MRNFINLTVIITIICSASLTTSSSANAGWDNGGIGYAQRHNGDSESRFASGPRTNVGLSGNGGLQPSLINGPF
jgi:hypothetical protein